MEGLQDVLDCIKVNDATTVRNYSFFSLRGKENSVV